ncbi:MAG: inositol monophosphatase [Verrucomicrobia bacterium]|nr:inositol monophosphatase [Verrucomicrobiota bacterium]
MDYSTLFFTAVQAALLAGNIIHNSFNSPFQVFLKEGENNLVTEVDLAAEKAIIGTVQSRFPDHAILSEEQGYTAGTDSPFLWIIDPLDGTFNFAHNVPLFAVSIAVAYKGELIVAVVYQPETNELFTAQKGEGAYLNGKKLSVSKRHNIGEALLGTDISSQYHRIGNSKGILRSLGAAVLGLSYVAAGRYDGYWVPGLQPWDIAAGKLLVEEAGGIVTKLDGKPYADFVPASLCASNRLLHDAILKGAT